MLSEANWKGLRAMAKRDKMLGVSINGALSQINHKSYLESQGYSVVENGSGNSGLPDFLVNGSILVEHKRISIKSYSNGDFKVQTEKTRPSINGGKKSRLYDFSWTDVFAVDVSRHTEIPNDYRYIKAIDLEEHAEYPEKIKSRQRVDSTWVKTLKEIIGVDDEES